METAQGSVDFTDGYGGHCLTDTNSRCSGCLVDLVLGNVGFRAVGPVGPSGILDYGFFLENKYGINTGVSEHNTGSRKYGWETLSPSPVPNLVPFPGFPVPFFRFSHPVFIRLKIWDKYRKTGGWKQDPVRFIPTCDAGPTGYSNHPTAPPSLGRHGRRHDAQQLLQELHASVS